MPPRRPLPFHPAAALFPLLDGPEFDALVADIEERGQLVPIVVYEGKILDGRNRYRACQQLGIKPLITEEKDVTSPTAHVLSLNLARRHLNPAQKAAVAVLAKDAFQQEARERMRQGGRQKGTDDPSVPSRPRHTGEWSTGAARSTGAGIGAVKTLDAVNKAAPEVFEAVRGGVLKTVADARRLAALPAIQRARVIEGLSENPRLTPQTQIGRVKRDAALSAIRKAKKRGDDYSLICGDLLTASGGIPDASVDLILTDPPYETAALPLYERLAQVAGRVLRPGGSLVVMTGQILLPDVLLLLRQTLAYQWTLAYTHDSDRLPIWKRQIVSGWRPILWLTKGTYSGKRILKDIHEGAGKEKALHDWQQTVTNAVDLVAAFSEPGELILDPFCGTGTSGVAALGSGRRFLGIDIDKEVLKVAASRLAEQRPAIPARR